MAAVGDVYQVKLYSLLGQQAGINVLHYSVTTLGGTGASDFEIGQAMAAALPTTYKALLSASASYRGLGIRKILPTLSIETYNVTAQGAGGVAGEALPKQISGLITLRTTVPGRAFRGRVYVPFPGEGDNDTDQTPTAGYITRLGNFAGTLITTVTAGGANSNQLRLGVFHRVGGAITVCNDTTARDRWATQRRRGDYGRTNILPI